MLMFTERFIPTVETGQNLEPEFLESIFARFYAALGRV